MARLAVSAAHRTFTAGLKPPLGISDLRNPRNSPLLCFP
jgi:hypothetical protein